MRDLNAAQIISKHLEKDWEANILPSPSDEFTYHIDMLVFYSMEPNYNMARVYGEKALKLAEKLSFDYEEKVRLYADWIQYYCLIGMPDKCVPFIEKGKELLPLSKSQDTNKLYLLHVGLYHLITGAYGEAATFLKQHPEIMTHPRRNPMKQFFYPLFLAEALIKQGEMQQAKLTLEATRKRLKKYYANEDNVCFGRLWVLTAMANLTEPQLFSKMENLLKKALKIYQKAYKGGGKHRTQAAAYLVLGRLYQQKKDYKAAKEQYLKSEEIFGNILQNKQIDNVSELYTQLALLGVDCQDPSLTHIYFKKHIETFGLDHHRTKDIVHYLDSRRLPLPF